MSRHGHHNDERNMTPMTTKDSSDDKNWIEMNDKLTEAMILLDPPFLPNTSCELTIHSVMRGYEILISINNDADNSISSQWHECAPHHHHHHHHRQPNDDANEQRMMVDRLPLMADVYRALILSSSLLLEMLVHQEHHEYDDSKQQQQQSFPPPCIELETICNTILQTIRRSILLLHRLGSILLQSNNNPYHQTNDKQMQQQKGGAKRLKLQLNAESLRATNCYDWHDDVLPPSQYPLLQECFLRRKMVSVEDDIVFGREDRQVSLDIEHYTANYYDQMEYHDPNPYEFCDEPTSSSSTNRNRFQGTDTNRDDNSNDDAMNRDDKGSIGVDFSMDPKQLAREEAILLDVAFAGKNSNSVVQRWRGRRSSDSSSIVFNNLFHQFVELAKSQGLLPFIVDLYDGVRPYQAIKSGYLLFSKIEESSSVSLNTTAVAMMPTSPPTPPPSMKEVQLREQTKCHIHLFPNGLLAVCTYSMVENNQHAMKNGNIVQSEIFLICTLNSKTTVSPMITGNSFHFQLENVSILRKEININLAGMDSKKEVWCSSAPTNVLLLSVDGENGGGLMDGYSWMTDLKECIENVTELEELQTCILEEWYLTDKII